MNNASSEKKAGLLKTLAIVGLLGVILIIAWVSIQIVSVFPTAINSLASLADSVYSYDPRAVAAVTIKPTEQPVITGKEFNLNWENPHKGGTYAFTYECIEDLEVELKTSESSFKDTRCDSPYNLGEVNSAALIINSDLKSVAELRYKITYFKSDTASSSAEDGETITILNPRLAAADFANPSETEGEDSFATTTEEIVASSTDEVAATSTDETILAPTETVSTSTTEVVPAPEETPEVITPSVPEVATTTPEIVVKPKPVVTQPVYEYTYAIPTSNPNGYTDLVVNYLGIGYVSNQGVFITTGSITKNVPGAMQFSVKNAGTKTSETWTFTANLPGDIKYESPTQAALKPNERAVLTLNFPAVTANQLYNFDLTAQTSRDINSTNNQASWTIVVIN